jgi:NADPH2 dehydrogenase
VGAHLDIVREAKAAHPDLVFVGTGYTYLMDWLPHVAQAEVRAGHVDLVGLGRMVLSYPELPRDVLAGRPMPRKLICRTFSDCTTAPRNGMVSGCYPLDPDYQETPRSWRSSRRPAPGPRPSASSPTSAAAAPATCRAP